tara:strand:- start:7737 stop:8627 length:891 start_codon:yes stop_codon:yes gene_type:complete
MENNEVITLDDRGFVKISGVDAKEFLQNIVTNDLEKVSEESTIFSSILTPQGKYLFEFFILKFADGYILECEKKSSSEILKIFNFYKLRSKVNFLNENEKYISAIISLEKFKEIGGRSSEEGATVSLQGDPIYIDPRSAKLGAKIISKVKSIDLIIKKLNLKTTDKDKYYNKSFELGIPQTNLDKLKDKIFGIENNLDELNGIDFKKGCYVGQENTSRIKLRNKLRRRILPIKKISGDIVENDIIKYKNNEIGRVMINKPYSFALIKVVDPDLTEFTESELICGSSKVKILKPEWI